MKVKTWLYPLVLIVSTLAVAIAMLFPLYNYVYEAGLINSLLGNFGVFTNFFGIDAFPTFVAITGIFASSYLILGFSGLLISVVFTVLKMTGFEIKNYALCNRIAAGIALIGTIGFVVSAITFICVNYYDLSYIYPGAHEAFTGTFALWLAMGGLILGTIASYLGAIDIAYDEKKAVEPKPVATAKIVEKETNNRFVEEVEISQTAQPKQNKTKIKKIKSQPAALKKLQPKSKAKNKKPEPTKKAEAKKVVKAEAKKVEAKPVAKVATKKAQPKKAEVKKVETKKAEPAKKAATKKVETKTTAKKTATKTTTKKSNKK